MDSSFDAEKWDKGSQHDLMRNSFVTPNLAAVLHDFKPRTILDVGAATGYIARNVDAKLRMRSKWTLLDQDEDRLNFAIQKKSRHMVASKLVGSFLKVPIVGTKYQAVIMSFTMLELGITDKVLLRIQAVSAKNGIVVVVLPDVWKDVLNENVKKVGFAVRFLRKAATIKKIDKFTGTYYPFKAFRLEELICRILRSGFQLVRLEKGDVDRKIAYMLTFVNG